MAFCIRIGCELNRTGNSEPGIADKHIKPSLTADNGFNRIADGSLVRDIGANALNSFFRAWTAAQPVHSVSLGEEQFCGSKPDSARSTGDKYDSFRVISHFSQFSQ